jgi:hypothetical protein
MTGCLGTVIDDTGGDDGDNAPVWRYDDSSDRPPWCPNTPPHGECSADIAYEICVYPELTCGGRYECVQGSWFGTWEWEEVPPEEGSECLFDGEACEYLDDETYGWYESTAAICVNGRWDVSGTYCEYQGPDEWCTDF